MSRVKTFLYISFLLFLLFFVACRPSTIQYPAILLQADSLAMVNPDSAVKLLDGLAPSMQEEDEPVRRYYSLLTLKAHDKAFLPHESDSLILDLLSYYEEKGDPNLLPEVYYYTGRVMCDLGDAPRALDYFEKALESVSQLSARNNPDDVKDYGQLESCIHAQKGYLFLLQNLSSYACNSFIKGYRCDSINGDTTGMIYHLKDIGQCLHQEGKDHLALFYYGKAEDLLRKGGTHLQLATVILHEISALLYLKEYDKAKELYLSNQALLKETKTTSAFSILANMFSKFGEKDTAAYYYRVLYKQGNLDQKRNADLWLAQNALNAGTPGVAIDYLNEYVINSNAISNQVNSKMIALANASYNYQLREKESMAMKEKNIRIKSENTVLLSLLVLLLLVGIFIIQVMISNRHKKDLQNENLQYIMRNQLDESIRTIAQNKDRIRELENLYYGTNEKNKELIEERDRLIKQVNLAEANCEIIESFSQKMVGTPIYSLIQEKCKSNQSMNEDDFLALEKQIRDLHPAFVTQLYNLTSLTEKERRISYLIKIKITQHNISSLLCLSDEGVSSARRRMFKKVFNKVGSAKDWDNFILRM